MTHFNTAAVDSLLARDLPVVTMPHAANAFVPLAVPGHRLIVAGNGLFKEVQRPWFYSRFQLASFETPFGVVTPDVRLAFKLPVHLISKFLEQSKRESPLETGAWIIWNEESKDLRYQEVGAIRATSSLLQYERPVLARHEHLILDIHSHHSMAAEFSLTDDADDLAMGAVAITGVLGRIDTEPELRLRLCLEGAFVPLNVQSVFTTEK